ncbi:MAG: transglutaminase-like domain-containing protein [Aeoliella sp.]
MLAVRSIVLTLLFAYAAQAQLLEAPTAAEPGRYSEPEVVQVQVGAEITASRGACRDILAMVAVPFECDEQQVQRVDEDFSRHIGKVKYRDLGGAQQMLITVPALAAGETARAVVTFEVRTKPILPPEEGETIGLSIPEKPERALRKFITASPYIETRDKAIRKLARQLWEQAGEESDVTDWERIELLYDHMLESIKYVEGPDKSAVTTLRDGKADCYGRSALFIALCRANKVPARIVWVNNHCYAEFYLENAEGEGKWHPIESAGGRAFGEMPLARTIFQKGDNFKVPERPKDRLRYATDWAKAYPVGNSGKPKMKYIREVLE